MKGIAATSKVDLRRQVGADLKALSLGARVALEQSICHQIVGWKDYCTASQVFGYVGLATEASLDALYDAAVSARKRLFLPRVAQDGSLNYAAWRPGDPLVIGRYGQLEPVSRTAPLAMRSLVLVPGIAFDTAGHRLGRGLGCYDRALPWLERFGPTVGVAYSKQVFEAIPCEEHDRSVGWLATEFGLNAKCESPLV